MTARGKHNKKAGDKRGMVNKIVVLFFCDHVKVNFVVNYNAI
jgi:hypothetical protein